MSVQTGCWACYPQMGFEEMWGFNRQTIALLQIALDQVILNLFRESEQVGRNP